MGVTWLGEEFVVPVHFRSDLPTACGY